MTSPARLGGLRRHYALKHKLVLWGAVGERIHCRPLLVAGPCPSLLSIAHRHNNQWHISIGINGSSASQSTARRNHNQRLIGITINGSSASTAHRNWGLSLGGGCVGKGGWLGVGWIGGAVGGAVGGAGGGAVGGAVGGAWTGRWGGGGSGTCWWRCWGGGGMCRWTGRWWRGCGAGRWAKAAPRGPLTATAWSIEGRAY